MCLGIGVLSISKLIGGKFVAKYLYDMDEAKIFCLVKGVIIGYHSKREFQGKMFFSILYGFFYMRHEYKANFWKIFLLS